MSAPEMNKLLMRGPARIPGIKQVEQLEAAAYPARRNEDSIPEIRRGTRKFPRWGVVLVSNQGVIPARKNFVRLVLVNPQSGCHLAAICWRIGTKTAKMAANISGGTARFIN